MKQIRRQHKIVYCAFNIITRKSYIGWCTDLGERKARHIRDAELGCKTRFHNAIRKYGSDSFEWFILFENLKTYDECKRMEQRMIALFDTYNIGYNATTGGDGGFTGHNTGQFKKGSTPWNTGKRLSQVFIDKLKSADRSITYKPVMQLNGDKINIFPSIKDASIITGISSQHISEVCRNISNRVTYRVTAGGYKWEFL